jgi:hypothetical protein
MESEINAYALFRNQRVVEIELRNIQTALKDFRGQLPNRPSKIRLGLVGSLLSFVIVAGLSAIPVAGVILKYVSLIPFPVLFVALAIAIIAGEFLAIRWLVGFSFDAPMYWSLQILGIFVAVVLIWALYPALAQLGAAYGALFLILAVILVIGAALSILRG